MSGRLVEVWQSGGMADLEMRRVDFGYFGRLEQPGALRQHSNRYPLAPPGAEPVTVRRRARLVIRSA